MKELKNIMILKLKISKLMFIKSILASLLILISFCVFGQQDAQFTQYKTNFLVLNPAYSGSRDVLEIKIAHREQWKSFESHPTTSTFSVQSPLRNNKIALGAYIFSDKLGPLFNTGIMFNYAYRIRIREGRLAFGIQGGLVQQSIDFSKLKLHDPYDHAFLNMQPSEIIPDINFGIYYLSRNWYLGLSSKHLFTQENSDYSPFSVLTKHFYGVCGFTIDLSNDIILKPSILFKYTKFAPISIDLGSSVYIKDFIALGLSYRSNYNAIIFLMELTLKKNIKFGYSYDAQVNKLSKYAGGSHELSLSFDFDIYKIDQKSRRYF